jgi:hypothetical protein
MTNDGLLSRSFLSAVVAVTKHSKSLSEQILLSTGLVAALFAAIEVMNMLLPVSSSRSPKRARRLT